MNKVALQALSHDRHRPCAPEHVEYGVPLISEIEQQPANELLREDCGMVGVPSRFWGYLPHAIGPGYEVVGRDIGLFTVSFELPTVLVKDENVLPGRNHVGMTRTTE